MAVPRRPSPRRAAEPPRPKGFPWLLVAILVLLAGGIAAVVVIKRNEPPPPLPVVVPPPPVEPEVSIRIYHEDLGAARQVVLLVTANIPIKAKDLKLVDETGREHPAQPASAPGWFPRESGADPAARAWLFQTPGAISSLDLNTPAGKKPVYRKPEPQVLLAPGAEVRHEDWLVKATATLTRNYTCDLEVQAKPAVDKPIPINAERLLLVTDEGKIVRPQVRTTDPLRLHYAGIPRTTRSLRLQTNFRGEKPEYWQMPEPPWPKEEAPKVEASRAETAKPVPGNLREELQSRLADPVAALKYLAERPSPEAASLARETIAKAINDDLAAGLKAFGEKQGEAAERHLSRAALLADPYSPDLSRQLMRLLFSTKQPRRVPTGCSSCAGKGSSGCTACQGGLLTGNCPRCDAKGTAPCILCEGSGQLDHPGYKGTFVLVLERELPFKYQGKPAKMPPQTLTYRMSPCDGKGSFQIHTETVVTATGVRNAGTVQQSCDKFWDEMKRFVFNGRSRIKLPNRGGQLATLSSSAGRRFFADYEICKGGHIACDRCSGRKTTPCGPCGGKGRARLLCSTCEGTALRACATCKGYGDASWLAKLLPSAPGLAQDLAGHARTLKDWMDVRALRASRREELARRIEEAKKDLDKTAKIGPDIVEIACPQCKGAGGDCADCWATGRREYHDGTPQYERYELATRLERQLAEASKETADAPTLGALAAVEPVALRPSSVSVPKIEAGPLVIPKGVEEMIRKADALHETGKAFLYTAKTSGDQAAAMEAAVRALNDLKQAQTLYASAQEKLDETGAPVPKELSLKFRTNMQALVIARRTAP